MDMNAMKGTQSIAFSESPYLVSAGSVAGKKEGEGPLGKYFDIASEDDLFGEKTWELAEGTMQKLACKLALKNAGVQPEEVRYLFGGDLLRQGIATSMGAEELQIPVFGLFGACSTSGEALALAAMTVAAGYGDLVLAATSSHFGSAEKEFRFPLGYANQRPLSSTWTVTGSGAFLVGKKKSRVRISGVTIGKIVDYGLKDSQNMGACMAPAACDTILQNPLRRRLICTGHICQRCAGRCSLHCNRRYGIRNGYGCSQSTNTKCGYYRGGKPFLFHTIPPVLISNRKYLLLLCHMSK